MQNNDFNNDQLKENPPKGSILAKFIIAICIITICFALGYIITKHFLGDKIDTEIKENTETSESIENIEEIEIKTKTVSINLNPENEVEEKILRPVSLNKKEEKLESNQEKAIISFEEELSKEEVITTIELKDNKVELSLPNTKTSTAKTDNNKISYEEVYKDTDIEYEVFESSIKEYIYLKSEDAKKEIPFDIAISNEVELEEDEEGGIFVSQNEIPLLYISPLIVWDKNYKNIDYHFEIEELESSYSLLIKPSDLSQFEEIEYPVTIDPSITWGPNFLPEIASENINSQSTHLEATQDNASYQTIFIGESIKGISNIEYEGNGTPEFQFSPNGINYYYLYNNKWIEANGNESNTATEVINNWSNTWPVTPDQFYGKILLDAGETVENIDFTYVLPTVNLELIKEDNNLKLNLTGETEISGIQLGITSAIDLTSATGTILDNIHTVNNKILAYDSNSTLINLDDNVYRLSIDTDKITADATSFCIDPTSIIISDQYGEAINTNIVNACALLDIAVENRADITLANSSPQDGQFEINISAGAAVAGLELDVSGVNVNTVSGSSLNVTEAVNGKILIYDTTGSTFTTENIIVTYDAISSDKTITISNPIVSTASGEDFTAVNIINNGITVESNQELTADISLANATPKDGQFEININAGAAVAGLELDVSGVNINAVSGSSLNVAEAVNEKILIYDTTGAVFDNDTITLTYDAISSDKTITISNPIVSTASGEDFAAVNIINNGMTVQSNQELTADISLTNSTPQDGQFEINISAGAAVAGLELDVNGVTVNGVSGSSLNVAEAVNGKILIYDTSGGTFTNETITLTYDAISSDKTITISNPIVSTISGENFAAVNIINNGITVESNQELTADITLANTTPQDGQFEINISAGAAVAGLELDVSGVNINAVSGSSLNVAEAVNGKILIYDTTGAVFDNDTITLTYDAISSDKTITISNPIVSTDSGEDFAAVNIINNSITVQSNAELSAAARIEDVIPDDNKFNLIVSSTTGIGGIEAIFSNNMTIGSAQDNSNILNTVEGNTNKLLAYDTNGSILTNETTFEVEYNIGFTEETITLDDIVISNTTGDALITSITNNSIIVQPSTSSTISGTAIDGPLAGANVALINLDNSAVIAETTTDANGKYSFDVNNIESNGNYKITVNGGTDIYTGVINKIELSNELNSSEIANSKNKEIIIDPLTTIGMGSDSNPFNDILDPTKASEASIKINEINAIVSSINATTELIAETEESKESIRANIINNIKNEKTNNPNKSISEVLSTDIITSGITINNDKKVLLENNVLPLMKNDAVTSATNDVDSLKIALKQQAVVNQLTLNEISDVVSNTKTINTATNNIKRISSQKNAIKAQVQSVDADVNTIATNTPIELTTPPALTLGNINDEQAIEDINFTKDISSIVNDINSYNIEISGSDWVSINSGIITGIPSNSDVGTETITVNVTDLSTGANASQNFNITILNVNDNPDGSVTITGDTIAGETLTATNNLSDEDGIGSITYTWPNNSVGESYTILESDVGSTLSVTASYTDARGKEESVTSSNTNTITSAKPLITLNGEENIIHEANTNFTDPGATASSINDGDITNLITTTSTLNESIIGIYYILYDVMDSSNIDAVQKVRTVNIVDTTKPVITITGDSNKNIEASKNASDYIDAGATANDSLEGDISNLLTTSGDIVDNTTLGQYNIIYNVSDSSGNAAIEKTRTVNVVDTTAPIITLNGESTITINTNDTFSDPGATVTDNYDTENIAIIADGFVDTNNTGTYTRTYNAVDSSGNAAAEVVRTVIVIVEENTPTPQPIVTPTPESTPAPTPSPNIIDYSNEDTDGDGVPNKDDAFPYDATYSTDADGDGIGDDWELANFSDLNTADHYSDNDGDGESDKNEWIDGTDPNSAIEKENIEDSTFDNKNSAEQIQETESISISDLSNSTTLELTKKIAKKSKKLAKKLNRNVKKLVWKELKSSLTSNERKDVLKNLDLQNDITIMKDVIGGINNQAELKTFYEDLKSDLNKKSQTISKGIEAEIFRSGNTDTKDLIRAEYTPKPVAISKGNNSNLQIKKVSDNGSKSTWDNNNSMQAEGLSIENANGDELVTALITSDNGSITIHKAEKSESGDACAAYIEDSNNNPISKECRINDDGIIGVIEICFHKDASLPVKENCPSSNLYVEVSESEIRSNSPFEVPHPTDNNGEPVLISYDPSSNMYTINSSSTAVGNGGASITAQANSLTTSEDGNSVDITVSLGTAPTTNVTIPVTSLDSSEGVIQNAITELVFTPADYADKTITIVGQDDIDADGDIIYVIEIGSAISSDINYSGLNENDIQLTNTDNEAPSGGGGGGVGNNVPEFKDYILILTVIYISWLTRRRLNYYQY